MARLIHLNGPSRVGKSTLARRFVDEHPGTFLLDLDVLVGLVGGWRRDFSAALEVARGIGRRVAEHHLHGGHDVLYPQLVTVFDNGPDPALEEVASGVSASYLEIALLVDEQEHRQRVCDKRPDGQVESAIQAALDDRDDDLVGRIRGHLATYLDGRPDAVRLDTTGLSETETYRRLLQILDSSYSQRR